MRNMYLLSAVAALTIGCSSVDATSSGINVCASHTQPNGTKVDSKVKSALVTEDLGKLIPEKLGLYRSQKGGHYVVKINGKYYWTGIMGASFMRMYPASVKMKWRLC